MRKVTKSFGSLSKIYIFVKTFTMTQQQRNWTIEAIINCMPLAIFQHEVERLETMMAKYVDPKTIITEEELSEDMTYLDNIYG